MSSFSYFVVVVMLLDWEATESLEKQLLFSPTVNYKMRIRMRELFHFWWNKVFKNICLVFVSFTFLQSSYFKLFIKKLHFNSTFSLILPLGSRELCRQPHFFIIASCLKSFCWGRSSFRKTLLDSFYNWVFSTVCTLSYLYTICGWYQ